MMDYLRENVSSLLEKFNVPGIAVGLLSQGKIDSIFTFGLADIARSKPVTEETIFQIASISKSITTWAVMKLFENDLIELDAPVENYLTRWQFPKSEFDSKEVTIRRLLSNTGGTSMGGYNGTNPKYPIVSIEEFLSGKRGGPFDQKQIDYIKEWGLSIEDQRGAVRIIEEPGRKFLYSGGGFTVLQLMIEEVSGQPFPEYLNSEILIPLGMKTPLWGAEIEHENCAKPYDDKKEQLPLYNSITLAAGGLACSIKDLAYFALAGMEGANGEPPGRSILKPESVNAMYEKQIFAAEELGFKWDYGLGHFITEINGVKIVQHSGGNYGWRSMMIIVPTHKLGIVILINSAKGNPVWQEIVMNWSKTLGLI